MVGKPDIIMLGVQLFSHDVEIRMVRLPALLANQMIQRFLDWSIPAC